MAGVIAFCETPNCGTIFENRNIIGGSGNATITITNSRVGPCPSCGGVGLIPDGVYGFANNAIKFLTGPTISVDALRKLEKYLRNAKKSNATKEEIKAEIAEKVPGVENLFCGIGTNNNTVQWLSLLVMVVTLAIMIHTSYIKEDSVTESQVTKYLLKENQQLKNENQQLRQPTTPNPKKQQLDMRNIPHKREFKKTGRNDPCPCGSGLKFKKCCWLRMA